SEDRRGVVASAATERRDVLLLIAADIARDDGDPIGSRKRGADALVDVRERTRGAEAAVGDEPGVEGIPSASRKTDRGEVRRDDAARESLAERDDAVLRAGRQLAQRGDSAGEELEVAAETVDERRLEAELAQDVVVRRADPEERAFPIAARERLFGELEEPVRDPRHRRDDDHRITL